MPAYDTFSWLSTSLLSSGRDWSVLARLAPKPLRLIVLHGEGRRPLNTINAQVQDGYSKPLSLLAPLRLQLVTAGVDRSCKNP